MNLLPTDEQVQLIEMANSFLAENAPVSRLQLPGAERGNNDHQLIPRLGALGLLGIALPEEQGGTGLTLVEEALVHQALGRFLLSPSASATMLGAQMAFDLGDRNLSAAFATGEAIAGLAVDHVRKEEADGVRLFEAVHASHVIWFGAAGVKLLPVGALRDRRSVNCTDSSIILESAIADSDAAGVVVCLPEGPLLSRLNLMLAAYSVGIACATTDMGVAYAQIREQFGKPIGSFQAIKHKCADMAIRAEAARCQSHFASVSLAKQASDALFQVSASKIVAVEAAIENAGDNIQVHGAIGFTSEIDAHWFLKRARIMDALGGNIAEQKRALLEQAFA